VAAARAAHLIAERRPGRVILVGVAGTYDLDRFPLGTARSFSDVALDGVGAGEGASMLLPEDLGFPQWPGGSAGGPTIGSRLPLVGVSRETGDALVLTVCAASASIVDADIRRQRHRGALAEEMEGFGVACACALANVPLTVIRGASNRAGDRETGGWRLNEALSAAATLARGSEERALP
jgi:futalosine hydrolase